MLELQGFRDTALMAWEKSIAATAVHYVNDTLGDYENFGTDSFELRSDLAKHWSELKGFVVSLQFNRRSPLNRRATRASKHLDQRRTCVNC